MKVVYGDYMNYIVDLSTGNIVIKHISGIIKHLTDVRCILQSDIKVFEDISQSNNKSAVSGALRGLVGNVLLGGIGTFAGVFSAKGQNSHIVQVELTDGKTFFIKCKDEKEYMSLIYASKKTEQTTETKKIIDKYLKSKMLLSKFKNIISGSILANSNKSISSVKEENSKPVQKIFSVFTYILAFCFLVFVSLIVGATIGGIFGLIIFIVALISVYIDVKWKKASSPKK